MRILIADDSVLPRRALAVALKEFGYDVLEASNGVDALSALCAADAPTIAVLDWMMPEMDGVDVCRRIREIGTDRPPYIIMLTGKGDKRDLVSGLQAGADVFLTKPFDLDELRAQVDVGRRIVDLQDRLIGRIDELSQALKEIKTLRGVIPICSKCKKVRDDEGYWQRVDAYVQSRSNAMFTHSFCPTCADAFLSTCDADEFEGDPCP